MNRWAARITGIGVLVAATITATAIPASAGNSDAYAPNASSRSYFCAHPNWWYVGFKYVGVTNNNSRGTWRIFQVVDRPQQTNIYGQFEGKWNVIWSC